MRELCIDLPNLLEQARASSSSPAPVHPFYGPPYHHPYHPPYHQHPDEMHVSSVPPAIAPHIPISAFPSVGNDQPGAATAAAVVRHLPRVDVLGDNARYVVEVELPGVEKMDVKLQLDEGRVVTVSALHEIDSNLMSELAQLRQQKERTDESSGGTTKEGEVGGGGEKGETAQKDPLQWHVRERRRGMFERSMKMPPNVDLEKLEAKFENGLLRIVVPKYQKQDPIPIPVV
eukprot:GHVS01059615.1.p1 GENE.GHVS01059615.1~~GHVS01059615.1.p1  ORF type:complete len:231 (-),score=56.96 GHVS01059615.1:271-963(-)